MARFFKGVSTEDIINVSTSDFMSWTTSQLRQAVSRLADTANKRASRLIKKGVPSYAIEQYYTNIGRSEGESVYKKFSTRGKSDNQLRQEFLRAKQFLSEESSTVSGAIELENEAIKSLNKSGIKMGVDDYRKLLKTYINELNKDPAAVARIIKYAFTRNTDIVIENNSSLNDIDKLSERLYIELDKTYRRGGTQYEGVADYFELDDD